MKRREFIAVVAGAGLVCPMAGQAQQLPYSTERPAVLGWLGYGRPDPNQINDGILNGLRDLGWIEGKTVVFEWRFAERQPSRLAALAAELIDRHVDLIIAASPLSAAAAKRATRSIPIIALADDMKASGFVTSVARPGGNVTGVSMFASELDAKRLALLLELVPEARRIAALVESSDGPSVKQVQDAAQELGVEMVVIEASSEAAIAPALDKVASRSRWG